MQQLSAVPNLIDQVHESLVDAIAAGALKPGERIRQEDLAARLGVSRQPVSHALQLLKRQGLVSEQGRRGLAIAPVEPQRIADLYEVRAALDELSARRAAKVVADGLADISTLQEARTALESGQALTDEDGRGRWINADVAYHSALHRLSGNQAALDIISDQWPHFKRCMGAVLNAPEIRHRVWTEHAGILAAIEAGAVDEAGRLARRHTEAAGADLVNRLEIDSDAA
ncbi:GntR family transcriptional regulator [Microbaculum marinisediminis]|uniref:GntR family transcriptional regulator n=1 Tax=Microbaculum marinisediminis TaxID=2931392 RepID=A0AAW5R651_9HYPH|nr:GntR family transcriptional regulator [Microbaculum sp. A6E488]MCT8974860.1 GntR family transcriptional regulator [Microbaculum sp. A6E488]